MRGTSVRQVASSFRTRQDNAYLSMLEVKATARGEGSAEDQLSDEDSQRIWRAGQALRRILAADIGGAEYPN
jgi:hypothetical protein